METEAVLFDLDGTLVDSLPLIRRTYKNVFDEMDIPWDEKAIDGMIGLPLKDIGEHFAGTKGTRFVELYHVYYHRDLDLYTKLFPDTQVMLANLQKLQIKLGIVTSKGRPGTTRTTSFTGIDCFMDVIITADDSLKHKPDPGPLLQAVEYLGADVSRSIYIGDSRFDILTGRNAGARTLGVTWGLAGRKEMVLLQPDGIIDRWEELKAYI
ncbi:MAG: HAD-IA family hydrolase [Peptococcaceae bacterium]|nr:HAD-IA family hydrolase [Peptococcaceae bacterium]